MKVTKQRSAQANYKLQNTNKLIFSAILLIPIFFFNSCNVISRIHYDTLRQSDTVIDLKIKSIDIVNKYWIDNKHQKINSNEAMFEIDSLFSFQSIAGMYNTLIQSPRFSILRADTIPTLRNESHNNRIELQKVNINTSVHTEPTKNYYTGNYYGVIKVVYYFEWSMISSENEILYKKNYHDTIWIEGTKSRFINIADLVDFDKAVYYIVNKTAVAFAESIAPYWRQTFRFIFTTGHNDFVIAASLAINNQWDEAEQLWQQHILGNNKNLAGKANYNMAVKSEKEGKLLDALHFINVACEKKFQPAFEYANIIKNRILEVEAIENQIP